MLDDWVVDVMLDEEVLELLVDVPNGKVESVFDVVLEIDVVEPLEVVVEGLFVSVLESSGYVGGELSVLYNGVGMVGPRVLLAMVPFRVDVATGYFVMISVQELLASHKSVQQTLLVLTTLPAEVSSVFEAVSTSCRQVLDVIGPLGADVTVLAESAVD